MKYYLKRHRGSVCLFVRGEDGRYLLCLACITNEEAAAIRKRRRSNPNPLASHREIFSISELPNVVADPGLNINDYQAFDHQAFDQ